VRTRKNVEGKLRRMDVGGTRRNAADKRPKTDAV
jgi:hypothetical protein